MKTLLLTITLLLLTMGCYVRVDSYRGQTVECKRVVKIVVDEGFDLGYEESIACPTELSK